ncbi:MGT family glycosyltransferase [Humibacillus xanthopallidus]|uniref:MGT family glycosyltransferase n=1 Tax=Humibacillus xanthopallidus TaxID=412689 RepID=A0A543PX27_9MICO|nr:glycosyltransferase [Humibacillus xanthopallidus]TQN48632.1 MGT family glycosyltransferase [Humibacillus xanthopallidus]
MRVLCATTAGTGHFGPMAPVAQACAAAGHEVRVAAPLSFASHVEQTGLPHEPFDDVPPEIMGPIFGGLSSVSMEAANHTVVRAVFGRLDAQAAFPGVSEVVERWRPDVVLRDPCEFGSLAAAERAGVPNVEVAIGIRGLQLWASELLTDPLQELDEVAGLPPGTCSLAMAAAPVLTSVPPGLEPEGGAAHEPSSTAAQGPSAVVRYRHGDSRSRVGSLPGEWGDGDHPLVYVTFGSVTGGFADLSVVFGRCLDALAERPVRVLLTTGHAGDPDELRPWPTNARVERWWPQEDVMPLASAMVGHGGFGTTMSALAAGVPQVVVPLFAFDQEINATRIAEVGAGIRLGGRQESAAQVGEAVSQVLDDGRMRSVAEALSDEIASLPDVSEIVESIEGLARRR